MAGFSRGFGFSGTMGGGTPPATPNLQEVTDVGNTTTNDIEVSDGLNAMRLEDSALVRDIGSFETVVNFTNPTANRTQTHQDASGTLALLEDLLNYILQGGNSFAAPLVIGTNDVQELRFKTGNVVKFAIDVNGKLSLSYLPDGTEMGLSMLSTSPVTGSTGIEFISRDTLSTLITNRLIASPDSFKFRNINTSRDWLFFGNNSATFGNTSASAYSLFLVCATQTVRIFTDTVRLFGIRAGASIVNQLTVRSTNVVGTDVVNYEALVTSDNDFPNRRYVLNNFPQKLLVQTTDVNTPTNNTIPNDLLTTYSLPVNTVRAGAKMTANASGLFSKDALGSIVFEVWLGATLIGYTAPLSIGAVTNAGFTFDAKMTFRTVGVAGTVMCGGSVIADNNALAIINAQVSGTPSVLPTTINTTISQQVRLTARFTSASLSNIFNVSQGDIYLQNT